MFQELKTSLVGRIYLKSSPLFIKVLKDALDLSLSDAQTKRYSPGSMDIFGNFHLVGLSFLSETDQLSSDIWVLP